MEAAKKIIYTECACKNPHGYKIPALSSTLLSEEIEKIMPSGIRALFLCESGELRKKLSRCYRLSDIEAIVKEGENIDLAGRDYKSEMDKIMFPEDIKLVISQGKYIPFAKYAADSLRVKHIACGGGNLSQYDYIYSKDAGYSIKKFSGLAAVMGGEEDINLPAGFAFVLASYLALFDWDISALLFKGNICSHIFKEAGRVIKGLMNAVRVFPKRSNMLKKEVFGAATALSNLIETAGAGLVLSGANQAAAALSMLYRHEERNLIDFYEISFLFAPTIAKIYAAFLESELPFCFPTDNNLHAEKLSEYLGIDESSAYNMLSPYLTIKDIELTDYRLNVYKDELLKHLYGVIRVLNEAYPVYFKLYDDDGFSLKGYMSSLDTSLSVGLACDCLRGDTLLNYISRKGLLDKYIR